MNSREMAVRIGWSFLGTPYLWGGDDPMAGFDCSGFIIELLKSVGKLPRKGDWTAQDLWSKFKDNEIQHPYAGCLVFWQNNSGRAIHIEMCLDGKLAIGASGGGGKTISVGDAIKQNAYIKIRPFASRSMIKGFLDPFKEED